MLIDEGFVFGAGGHGKVVVDAMELLGYQNLSIYDDDQTLAGQYLLGHEICTPIPERDMAYQGHVAIGNNQIRKRFFMDLEKSGRDLLTIIHPMTSLAKSARLDKGCFVGAYAVLAPDSALAKGVIVNHGAVVDHDCIVGAFSHIAPQATLGGGVQVGEDCLIGAGAVILPGLSIANGVTVAAGAVVTTAVRRDGVVVRGVPAR